MLNAIIKNAIPLANEATIDDPWDWGIRARVKRAPGSWYEDAKNAHPDFLAYQGSLTGALGATLASTQGARRRKFGKVEPLERPETKSAPKITIDMLADQIVDGVLDWDQGNPKAPIEIGEDAREAFRITAADPKEQALQLLRNAPGEGGRMAYMPAAFRDGKPVRQVRDLHRERRDAEAAGEDFEDVPYGGWQGDFEPTLCNMVAQWLVESAIDPETFEGDPEEVEAEIATVRPTSDGAEQSSEHSEGSSAAP